MKRKVLAGLLCAAMAFSMAACGDSNANDTPTVTEMADYGDLNQVLSGEYVITEEILGMYFSNVLYDAGVGVMEVTDRDTVQDGDIVSVKADNERGTTFNHVKIRVDESFTTEMHIDTDEANACQVRQDELAAIIL